MRRVSWELFPVVLAGSFILLGASGKVSSPVAERLSPADSMKKIQKNQDYVDLSKFKNVRIDLKYATTDNFMGINMYGPFKTAFLHRVAAQKFEEAVKILGKERPGWSFIVFDALRPRSVQWIMWDRVKDTKDRKYVANAEKGSVHNFGFALDISLQDGNGRELDMGTPYDSFSDLSQPKLEDKFLKEGKLTKEQIANRLILRDVMTRAGFHQLSHEWWHYDLMDRKDLEGKYPIVE